ncbi:MAG: hypothetical protein ACOVRB_09785 [Akkermansiaceae bacterium]|jgi:hypothetical protein
MNKEPRLDWESIVARVKPPAPMEEAPPPPTLTHRVLERWKHWRHDTFVRRWARWALGAAIAAIVLCTAAWIYRKSNEEPLLLPPPPPPELPAPTALPPSSSHDKLTPPS